MLQHLSSGAKPKPNTSEQSSDEIDCLLKELDLPNDYADGPGNDDEAWHAKLMELVNSQQEITPAQVNAKRKQLTFAAFRDPQIAAKTTAVEALIAPNVHKMHKLFQRSAAVASIQRLPRSAETERAQHVDLLPGLV